MRSDLFPVHEMVFDKAGKRNYWIIYPEPKVGYMRSGSIFFAISAEVLEILSDTDKYYQFILANRDSIKDFVCQIRQRVP